MNAKFVSFLQQKRQLIQLNCRAFLEPQTSIKLKKKTAKDEFNAKKILEKTSSYSEQQGFY